MQAKVQEQERFNLPAIASQPLTTPQFTAQSLSCHGGRLCLWEVPKTIESDFMLLECFLDKTIADNVRGFITNFLALVDQKSDELQGFYMNKCV